MTALEAVAVHVPPDAAALGDLAAALGLTPRQAQLYHRFHGLDRIALAPGDGPVDRLAAAANALDALRGREDRVRYLIYARSTPIAVPYPLSPPEELRRTLGLYRATAFTVTHHACATGLLALDIAGRLLAAEPDPDALALVVAGEKAFTRDTQLIPNTSICAEASAACLVRAGGGRDRILSYAASLRGEFDGRLAEDPDLLARFQREYPLALAQVIEEAVHRAGLSGLDEVDLILPHNVNRVSWQTLCRRTGYPVERVLLDNVPRVGHSFAADAFVNYRTAVDRGLLAPGAHYLVAAAGIGAVFSAMVLRH